MTINNTPRMAQPPVNNPRLGAIKWALLISLSLGVANSAAGAEAAGESKQNSRDVAQKPSNGKGSLPSFEEADVNGDHLITKNELQNFPYLLQVFNKVDAGEDGKLEQHEYHNLQMETKREAQVR